MKIAHGKVTRLTAPGRDCLQRQCKFPHGALSIWLTGRKAPRDSENHGFKPHLHNKTTPVAQKRHQQTAQLKQIKKSVYKWKSMMFCNIAENPECQICLGFCILRLGHDSAIPYSSLALFWSSYLWSLSSLPCREISLVSQFSESCCKWDKFLSW